MENRRTIIKSAIAALTYAAIPSPGSAGVNDWLLIADSGVNAYGRKYSPESLRVMTQSCKGATITANPPEGQEDFGDAMGVVSDSRLHDGAVFVRVKWFTGKRPQSGFLTPWGVGRVNLEKPPTVEDYRLERVVWSGYSSFAKATPV